MSSPMAERVGSQEPAALDDLFGGESDGQQSDAAVSPRPAHESADDGPDANGNDDDGLGDLFGDEPADAPMSRTTSSHRNRVVDEDEDDEDHLDRDQSQLDFGEAAPQPPHPVTISATPQLFVPGADHYISRIPGFLHVDPQAFDPATYEERTEEEHPEALKLQLENTIRWREVKAAATSEPRKAESNARFVKWSDGTMSLALGQEYFDVIVKATDHPHSLLTTLPPQDEIQQGCCAVGHHLFFRPSSTTSQTHKKFTKSITDRHKKKVRTKLFNTTKDPEQLKREMELQENEKLKAIRRLEASRQRKAMRYSMTNPGGSAEFNEASLEAEEYATDRDPYGTAGRRPRGSGGRYDADEDDGFVVDDEDEDVEYGDSADEVDTADRPHGYSRRHHGRDDEYDKNDGSEEEDDARERRILQAKQRGMESYHRSAGRRELSASPRYSDDDGMDDRAAEPVDRPQTGGKRVTKRQKLVYSDEDDD
ncbi:Paf1 complex component [Tieghemiomyces parasiticus]|uniref:Paf1 complex component n=1 Tax=Tieghemiomyces parasiticus TaxID=78921 RepID=A0A9W8AM25_9FUNG|nr:Paf1 complex component [Tieghemiomyces parasiticus]